MKKTFLFTLVLGFVLSATVFAQDSMDKIFKEANHLYKQGNYDKALANYFTIEEKGYLSADLNYNIGNAYAKKNDFPKALLYYERALVLSPKDADLLHNRNYVAGILGLAIEEKLTLADKAVAFLFSSFNLKQMGMLLNVLCIALVILLTLRIYLRKKVHYAVIACLSLVLLVALAAKDMKYTKAHATALVMKADADVMYEPVEKADIYFSLLAGQKVHVVKKVDGWTKISVNGNKKGWIKTETIAPLMI